MYIKFFIILFFLVNFFFNLYADARQLIVNKLIDINNITFDFKQTTNKKEETGTCILVFDNKLNCDYKNSNQKEILINGNILVFQQKRYDKKYFFPISKSVFTQILNKKKLIDIIKKSNYLTNNNIELIYVDENNKLLKIYFDKKTYNILGWTVNDQLQNTINFSLKIIDMNNKFDPQIFKIPSVD
jgi:outer membrane lipoprotein-sorting protein